MMRHAVVIGVLAIAVASVRAQMPPARDTTQSVAPPTGTGALSGIVKDNDDNPVRRCIITITGDMRLARMTVADDDGRFSFTDLPSGRFTITAKKAGYPEMSYGAKRPFRTGSGVFLQEGQQLRDIALTLARGAAMSGTVYDDHGQPMPGVPVMAWEIRTSLGGMRTLDYPASGTETVFTDDRGMYRVYGLPPGDYTIGTSWYSNALGPEMRVPTDAEIRAAFLTDAPAPTSGAPMPPPPDTRRYNYSAVFSPGVLDPLSAATFALAAGDERSSVDLRMQFVQMSGIEGTVVAPDGAPVPIQLTITRRSPVQALNISSVRSTTAGVPFNSGSLSPDTYTVMAEVAESPGRPAMWAMSDVIVGGSTPTAVALVLQPAPTVSGRLVFDGSLPPPADLSRISVSLRTNGPGRVGVPGAIDAAGNVSIKGVIPGPYTMFASLPTSATPSAPTWRVRSIVVDGQDVTDRSFDIGAGGASGLVITFTDQVSELSGSLTLPSGAPATDYFVIAIPADRTYWIPFSRRIASTRPDRAGRYLFRGLPPGDYRIALTTDLVSRDLQEVSALEQLAAQSVPVTLTTGEKRTLDLRPGSGG